MNKFGIILLVGLISLMVIVAGCGLTPGESLAGNARSTGKARYMAPQTNERAVSSPVLERGECFSDTDCAAGQVCQGAKNAANPKYSVKGSCVVAPCTPGPTGKIKCVKQKMSNELNKMSKEEQTFALKEFVSESCQTDLESTAPDLMCGIPKDGSDSCREDIGCCVKYVYECDDIKENKIITTKNICTGKEIKKEIWDCSLDYFSKKSGEKRVCAYKQENPPFSVPTGCFDKCDPGNIIYWCSDTGMDISYRYICNEDGLGYKPFTGEGYEIKGCPKGTKCNLFTAPPMYGVCK